MDTTKMYTDYTNPQNNINQAYTEKKSFLGQFFNYIKKPYYIHSPEKKQVRLKFWDIFRLLSASLIIATIIGIIITFALIAVDYDTGDHALSDPKFNNPLTLFFLGVIFAPFIEEIAFRMGLKFSPFRVSFSLAALFSIFFFTDIISLLNIKLPTDIEPFAPWLTLLIAGVSLGFVLRYLNEEHDFEGVYRKYFFLIFYASVFLFAGIHLTNYDNFSRIWFLAPLLVAPQFIGGITMGFTRVHYGLRYSILFHMLWNGFLFSPTILLDHIDSLNINKLSEFDFIALLFSSLTLIGIVLAVLIATIFLLVEFAQKEI